MDSFFNASQPTGRKVLNALAFTTILGIGGFIALYNFPGHCYATHNYGAGGKYLTHFLSL